MTVLIERPTSDYDPRWIDYWAQNPGMMRAVGADAPDPAPDPAPAPNPAPNPAPDPAPAPNPAPVVDWRAPITDPEGKKFAEDSTDINHLVGRALDMRKKLSTAIVPPGKDAKPEEVAQYRKKIGVPDTAEGYVFKDPEGYTATEQDKTIRGAMARAFHDNNIPASVAEGLIGVYRDQMQAVAQALKDNDKRYVEETEAALRKEWGGDFDKNDAYARRAAKELLGPDAERASELTDKNDRLIFDHPILRRVFAKIGREMGEDRIGAVLSDTDVAALDTQISDLRRQQSEAQGRGDNRKANELYQQEQALIAKKSGTKPVVGAQGRAA